MSAADTTAVRLVIHGWVQGVWYRGWTQDTAAALGLSGWVRNRRDGTVEVLLVGAPATVEAMIAHCRDGPPAARVDHIDRFPVPDEVRREHAGTTFEQRPTS